MSWLRGITYGELALYMGFESLVNEIECGWKELNPLRRIREIIIDCGEATCFCQL